jgi:transcriptional regulator with XRE-family HTH domain
MAKKQHPNRIPEAVLVQQWFSFLHQVLAELQAAFRRLQKDPATRLTQQDIADRLGMQPAQVSRYLRGHTNMTLMTMHKLARAMGCRLEIRLRDLNSLPAANDQPSPNENPYSRPKPDLAFPGTNTGNMMLQH